MPLLKNTFQPFFPDPDSPMPKSCNGEYCNLVANGDIFSQEWYQTPCAGNLACDPEFEDFALGAELIAEGGFPCPATAWTYGTNWSCVGNVASYSGLSSSPTLSQSGIGLVAGNLYQITFDLEIGIGGTILTLGSGAGATGAAPFMEAGSQSVILFYNDTDDLISFAPASVGNTITIDNVSVKQLTMDCWSGDYWTFDSDSGTACKTETGVSANLINGTTDYITLGDYYQVEITVDGYGGGSGQLYIDDGTDSTATNVQAAITANGTYTYWITAGQDGVIGFDPNDDFVGCVAAPTIRRLRNDFTFELINDNGAGDSIDISYLATYTENRINLDVDFGALLEAGTIDYGCFKIYAYDACLVSGDDLVQDGDFAAGNFTDWVRNSPTYQYQMIGGELQFIFDPMNDGPDLVTNGDFSGGATGWTGSPSWTITAAGATHVPGNTTPLSQSITIATPAVPPLQLFTWWQIRIIGRTAGSVTVSVSNVTGSATTVDNTYTNVFVPTIGGGPVTLAITPTSTFDGTIELVQVIQTSNSWNNPVASNPINPDVVDGNYQLSYDITAISGTTANTIGASASIRYPLLGNTYDRTVASHSHTQDYTPGSTIIEIQGSFSLNGNFYPGTVNVDNYVVIRIEPFEATYLSECINFQETHPNTTLVTGWCDRDALGSTFLDALGFLTTGYRLQMRIECRSYAADMDIEANLAKFSDGNSAIKYAQYEKFWQFVTGYMSEPALIALGGMAYCDHFTIGELGETATEYTVVVERFTPAWNQNGSYDLAPALLTIRKKIGGMKFNRHT